MKLQVGLQDISNALNNVYKIQDPAAREVVESLVRVVDALVINMRSMAGENTSSQRGNIDPDVLVYSIQDLIDSNVLKEETRRDLSNLLDQEAPRRYIAVGYGENKRGGRLRRGGR